MLDHDLTQQAVIIGGGVYGSLIAIYLAKYRGLKNILVVEQESALMTRASYNNQARVHNGYHYPRSLTTASRSRINLSRFIQDWPEVIRQDFENIYAIARKNSKVTATQFERFCDEIGAEIETAGSNVFSLFEPRLIESAYLVKEYVFDSKKLAESVQKELKKYGVKVCFDTRVTNILKGSKGLNVVVETKHKKEESIFGDYVFNCTYSGLNQLSGDYPGTATQLKHEITEMALLKMPPSLEGLGITVMDGPFFSMMPFPSRGLHTLSHVRYTPHLDWSDESDNNPYTKMNHYERLSRVDRMLRDTARYLLAISEANYVESLFEIKTVLVKNEVDDGRPILYEKHPELPNCYSILGGKIDNIYDVFERLDAESFV